MGNQFTSLQEIYTAYRRFKNYYYYDNNNLFIRNQIAEFECGLDFNKKKVKVRDKIKGLFAPFVDTLNQLWSQYCETENLSSSDIPGFQAELNKIACYVIPKSTVKEDKKEKCHFITNRISEGNVRVESCNFMIEAPILIHIISILWIERVGVKLYSFLSKDNYAYKLNVVTHELDQKASINDSLMLFHPYFIGYQEWRDNALDEAKRLLDSNKDVTILSLDIKRYYYSVRLNVVNLVRGYVPQNEIFDKKSDVAFLSLLLQLIHEQYQVEIEKYLDDKTTDENVRKHETVLPVGLLSSGILANLYLSKFDKYVVQKVAPSYYGRYVDDMVFVFQNRQVEDKYEGINPVDKFLKDYFCSVGALKEEESITADDGNTYYINESGQKDNPQFGNLRIQTKKVILEHFDHLCSHAAIDIFMRNLTKNRSEYRFLPDEENITAEFDNEAYQLLYDESINKIRSIKDFKEDKYGASKYLAKQIYLSKLSDTQSSEASKRQKEKVAHQLLTFFVGSTAVDMYSLWEKVATYFVLSNDYASLVKFYYNVKRVVEKVELSEAARHLDGEMLKRRLLDHLQLSLAMPMALAPNTAKKQLKDKLRDADKITKISLGFRHSNMLRSSNIALLGVNLTDDLYDDDIALNSDNLSFFSTLKSNDGICLMSPRYIRFEELNMLSIYRSIKNDKEQKNKIYESIEKDYRKYSRNWMGLFGSNDDEKEDDDEKPLIRFSKDKSMVSLHDYGDSLKEYTVDKKIAVVNKKVDECHFKNVVKYQKPLQTLPRKQELVKIINEAIEQGCHILAMPELMVPFGWLSFLVERAKQSDLAIVTGLEYCVCLDKDKKRIANYVATILPIREKYLKSCFVHLREKNFYSPKEKFLLNGYQYDFAEKMKEPQYMLFHWRKSYFSVYNCYELADIQSRAKFVSKVDFIIAVEYNRDIHYFSDVVGSWARDIHCFIVQVNSSNFGDSKILMPSKTDEKTLMQVKGGDNTVVLVCTLPIRRLRDFQLATYVVQQEDKLFKFTPPNFNHEFAFKRYEDKCFDK